MYDILPHITLSKEQRKFCFSKSIHAAKLLKKWSKLCCGLRKTRQFRGEIFKNDFSSVPKAKLKEFKEDFKIILEIHKKPQEILENRTIEESILYGYSKLIQRIVKPWTKQLSKNGFLTEQDLLQEAIIKLIDCVYGYCNPKINFITYSWYALQRSVWCCINKGNSFRSLKNDDSKLSKKYKDTCDKVNGPFNFENIADLMKLNQKDRKRLQDVLSKVVYSNEITELDGNSEIDDYTGLARNIKSDSEKIQAKIDLEEILNIVELTELEHRIIKASLSPYHGWQTDFANTYVDPQTKKRHSAAWVWMKYKSTIDKIRKKVCK